MNPIGIMQGRLSPPIGGRIQSFPVDTWREEFYWAREAGLDCIEWIYETGADTTNPLQTTEGIAEMQQLIEETGVAVWSVCADYYMTERLVLSDGTVQQKVVEHLVWLVKQTSKLGIEYIVLPFVDESSLKSPEEINGLLTIIRSVIPPIEAAKVELHLETDWAPSDLVSVLTQISHPLVRANYDIGNSASLGHDFTEELTLLGQWLGSVHVKDRVRGGTTVPLGTGSADFLTCFRLISAANFQGTFILQAARKESSSEIELAIRNRHFIENHLTKIGSS